MATITGRAGNDVLRGGPDDDILDGRAGADVMYGGGGDDIYFVDNVGDEVRESANAGVDQVVSSVTFNIGRQSIEELTLIGSANISALGSTLENTLHGDSGNNLLDGKSGADAMYGGAGNDIYYVDNTGDTVHEASNEGFDKLFSTVSYDIAGQSVEQLTLLGSANINGSGNVLNNVMYGSSGNNVLDGKAGTDFMYGGARDDTYYVDTYGDYVREAANSGYDKIVSSVGYAIGAESIEEVMLTGNASVNVFGNNLANILTGNSGDNPIDGGLGSDTLTGGGGNDTFYFDTALTDNVDVITDFASNEKMLLDRTFFHAITQIGTLSAAAFHVGTAAHDSNDYILYNSTTGDLFYDRDGAGTAAAVQFAHLNGAPVIDNTNFRVIS